MANKAKKEFLSSLRNQKDNEDEISAKNSSFESENLEESEGEIS